MNNYFVPQNLKILLKHLGISQKEFARSLHMDPAVISKIINNKLEITDRALFLIEQVYGINKDWLVHNEGDMFLPENTSFPCSIDFGFLHNKGIHLKKSADKDGCSFEESLIKKEIEQRIGLYTLLKSDDLLPTDFSFEQLDELMPIILPYLKFIMKQMDRIS